MSHRVTLYMLRWNSGALSVPTSLLVQVLRIAHTWIYISDFARNHVPRNLKGITCRTPPAADLSRSNYFSGAADAFFSADAADAAGIRFCFTWHGFSFKCCCDANALRNIKAREICRDREMSDMPHGCPDSYKSCEWIFYLPDGLCWMHNYTMHWLLHSLLLRFV